jgi:anaphase-promoting complex subunit 2
VVVKLELADRVVEVEATPLQASITELFENQDTWDVQAMSDQLGVDLFQVRNGLAFWANEGVVKEEKGVWRLLENAEEGNDVPGKLHLPWKVHES